MRVLCIARHIMLSRHIAALCADAGGDCRIAVGADEGLRAARHEPPDVVLCEVDLLVPETVSACRSESLSCSIASICSSLRTRFLACQRQSFQSLSATAG